MNVLAPEHTMEAAIEAEGGWVDDEEEEMEGELGQVKKGDQVCLIKLFLRMEVLICIKFSGG